MRAFERVQDLLQALIEARHEDELAVVLGEATREMGFRHFALTHHVDLRQTGPTAIRLHNYPDNWVEFYDRHGLGVSDPVHRGAQMTSVGFAWADLPALIDLTPRDHDILLQGELMGIGDGFTVPAHVPGEDHGSCSFANPRDIALQESELPVAQLVGAFAFEAARRLWRVREAEDVPAGRLTDRQRECLLWVARGKTDWEISRILGVSHETVVRHLKLARERYGVTKRTMLAIHALFDGSISFTDILKR